MARADLDVHLDRIAVLAKEIGYFVPAETKGVTAFRADLAGLLVVTTAASYESCVKETLVGYAARHHLAFEKFASNNYRKLNSRININDLHQYAGIFDDVIADRFKNILKKRKSSILERAGQNIEQSYRLILDWRHDFAHAGIRNTTIEEVVRTHTFARRVLYAFDEAFG